MDKSQVISTLQEKIKRLHETIWEQRAAWPVIERWLGQFPQHADLEEDGQVQALFLLSHFMYFGVPEIRELLRALFRDLVRYPMIQEIRRDNKNTRDVTVINPALIKKIDETRFVGIGNPSESGYHLLYYFRQENQLSKDHFIHTHEIFTRHGPPSQSQIAIRNNTIQTYIFLDDICASGVQAAEYAKEAAAPLKQLNKSLTVNYFTLFGTTAGLELVRQTKIFDRVQAVVELDETFKCFADDSRIYMGEKAPYNRINARKMCEEVGKNLWPPGPLGWRDSQMLLGFSYNTPDNTLPIFWSEGSDVQSWTPIFKRYAKF